MYVCMCACFLSLFVCTVILPLDESICVSSYVFRKAFHAILSWFYGNSNVTMALVFLLGNSGMKIV